MRPQKILDLPEPFVSTIEPNGPKRTKSTKVLAILNLS